MDVAYTLHGIQFEWDSRKASANVRKHGVTFETACEAFFDPFVRWMDPKVVDGESRERLIGMTTAFELLVVAYVDRRDSMRMISARRAIRRERRNYENQ
jgi:uncharacterized DUF497 family protein